ncbi:uncharacterized protein H6S33_008394 [Morchella sextelata]|uniref:uncharacterized protein n=1 Tax=Morchella sextelata TaxID=1174677 RepID=UPI001D045FB4|nr:uncharacterized protein H6S33_008394 [Morchella sextelata]KAH0602744.1 hypothetical protein H6S33_008394 [Morchella sextelata]
MPVLREGRAIIMAVLVPNSWCGSAAQHGLISCLGGVGEYISDHRDFVTSRLRMIPHGEGYHGPGPPPPTTRALPAVYKLRRRPRSPKFAHTLMLNPNDNAPDIMNCDTTTSPEELNWAPDMMDCDTTTSSEEPNWEETWAALETGSTQGDQICPTTLLVYSDLNQYLKRLGVLAGYPQKLTTYVLRRGAANAVDCPEVTDVQRNQIMGHARADVFRKHYLHSTVKVDTQSAYLGTVSRADLIRNIGLMSANRDPRAPVRLKPGFKLDNHPEIAALKAERDRMGRSLRAEYGMLKASESAFPAGHEAYIAAKRKLNACKVSIKRAELEQSRKTFFERDDHEEIQHQLRGAEASMFTYTEPKLCPLRTLVATYHKGGSDIS